ncbi:MAG: polyketide cyclase [Brachymonas sp.]|nr:polyketide cyclase [Brachymonas sp.]
MQIESSILVKTPANTIYALYADVNNWNTWDTDLKSSSINGAFANGATGEVVPKGGPKSKVVFSDIVPNKSFSVECKLPLCKMRFEHELQGQGNGTKATHRVVFEGLLAPLFGRLIGSGMRKTLPHAMESLKQAG